MSEPPASADPIAMRMQQCEERIGYHFRDSALLRRSLTHSSGAPSRLDSNERLEFLGDAVLGMVICEELFARFPNLREGDLTQQKSQLVSRAACARVARKLGASEFVLTGKGLQSIPDSVEAALVEALIAAIYLDGGLQAAREFILRVFAQELDVCSRGQTQNYKSLLQEETQRLSSEAPSYILLDQRGPDHAREYCVAVSASGQRYEAAWGYTKKEAEQKAARNALKIINPDLLPEAP